MADHGSRGATAPRVIAVPTLARILLIIVVASLGAFATPAAADPGTTKDSTTPVKNDGPNPSANGGVTGSCSGIGVAFDEAREVGAEVSKALASIPESAATRVISGSRGVPAAPEIELSFSAGAALGGRDAAGRVLTVVEDVSVVALADEDSLQVVGITSGGSGVFALDVEHERHCNDGRRLALTKFSNGVALDAVEASGRKSPIAWISSPWAIDAHGDAVPTWFEVEGTTLRQFVDTRSAVGAVTFDPTYSVMFCHDYQGDRDADTYLNLRPDDFSVCPIMGMFVASRGYRPVFAFETNVAREYGLIAVKQDGECSTAAPDTSTFFDFQVPCKAHDYCYDLRRANFSATVSDSGCDEAFRKLLEAHCKHRSIFIVGGCFEAADLYAKAVALPLIVADPEPFYAYIQNSATFYCLNVEGAGGPGAVLIQYGCIDTTNGHFRIEPAPGYPGEFRLQAQHSLLCAHEFYGYNPVQGAYGLAFQTLNCNDYDYNRFRVISDSAADQYTFRVVSQANQKCMSVPNGTGQSGVWIVDVSCQGPSEIWYISS